MGRKRPYLETAKTKRQSPVDQEIERLVGLLSEGQNPKTKIRAADELGKIGEPAVTALRLALAEETWEVRSNVILALEKIGAPATHVFQEAMTDQDWFVRATAAKALGQIKDVRAVNSLISVLNDKDWFVRERAAEALSKIGEPAVGPLILALKDRNGLVRERAAEALGKIGEPAVGPLILALKDRNGLVRERAADVLGKIGDAKSMKPLMEAFQDNELYVRAKAILAFESVRRRINATPSG